MIKHIIFHFIHKNFYTPLHRQRLLTALHLGLEDQVGSILKDMSADTGELEEDDYVSAVSVCCEVGQVEVFVVMREARREIFDRLVVTGRLAP